MSGTLRNYKIFKDTKVFDNPPSNSKQEIKEESKQKSASSKSAGRPKKSENEICDKKIIIYFTESEHDYILQKIGNITASPFLKKIILDNLK
jgi:hypothetical protein